LGHSGERQKRRTDYKLQRNREQGREEKIMEGKGELKGVINFLIEVEGTKERKL